MSEPIFRFLQISDLHIGNIDPLTGDAQLDPRTLRLHAHLPWLDGVLGHHGRGLEDLAAFYATWPREPDSELLVMTGDLTRVGGDTEFDRADDFLISQVDLSPPNGRFVGLHCHSWKNDAIPGNHDHWIGQSVIWGGPGAAFPHYFPPGNFPYVLPPITLTNGRVLEIIGINTDADVSPYGLKRFRAVGSFQNQLAAAAKVGRKHDGRIRILLMHHSWAHRGFLLSIDRGTRSALEQWLVAHEIDIMMSGHLHEPLFNNFTARFGSDSQTVLECRCGATTIADQVPYAWRNYFGSHPNRTWPKNSLIEHSLFDQGSTTRWRAQAYDRSKTQGFLPVPNGHIDVHL